jgi:hypothetical protein
MQHPARKIGRAFWVAFACLLMFPVLAAAAEEWQAIDGNGNGRHERVTLDRREPTALQVWRSAAATRPVLHISEPREPITRDRGWHVRRWEWQRQGRYPLRPHTVAPGTGHQPSRRTVDDQDSEPAGATSGSQFPPFAITPSASSPPSSPERAGECAPRATRVSRPFAPIEPFAPRPPPPSAAL